MALSLLYHSALAMFAQHTRIPTSARSIGFCAIWVCIRFEFELWELAKPFTFETHNTVGNALHGFS